MILIISAVFPPEPMVSASLSNDLAIALSKNWDVKVITPKPSRPFGFSFKDSSVINKEFEQIILNSFVCPESRLFCRLKESYSFGRHAAKFITNNRKNTKCIYINTFPLIAQYLIIKTAKRYSIPTVIHIQDIYPESLYGKLPFLSKFFIKLLIPFDRWIQKNSSLVIAISSKMKHFLEETRYLQEHKVKVIYNWQNEERFITFKNSRKKEMMNSNFTFMFLGNLNRTAAIDIIIYAFKRSGLKNARLVIAGSGTEKDSLLSLTYSLKGLNVEFWDAPILEVPEIQDKADVFVLSLKKGAALFALPSKLPAYMFSEKPIIACVEDASDTADAIRKANCGWIVPPEDVDTLSEIMKNVSSMPEVERQKYGRNAFNFSMDNFSKRRNLQKLVNIVNDTAVV